MRTIIILLGLLLLSPAAGKAQEARIETEGGDTLYFGDCLRGDTIEAVFRFTVAGSGKLLIRQVHPGCQCTVPQYPKDSLETGHRDSIVLAFHSRNLHEGSVEKYAIVINTGPERIFWLKGNVVERKPGDREPGRRVIRY